MLLLSPGHAATLRFNPPTRDFGYFPGDRLHTEAVATLAPGERLDAAALPSPGAVNAAVELRAIGWKVSGGEVIVTADYQTFLAADHVSVGEIPAYELHLVSAAGVRRVAVPAWTFHASPLRASERAAAALPSIRPDPRQPEEPTSVFLLRALGSGAAAMGFGGFLAGRLGLLHLRRRHPGPFAAAAAAVARAGCETDATERAFLALHRAFDAVAGRSVLAEDLPAFMAAQARFAPASPDIARFFSASHARFFSRLAQEDTAGRSAVATGWGYADLLAFARRLRRLERRG